MPRKKKIHPDILAWNKQMDELRAKWNRTIELQKKLADGEMTTGEFLELMKLLGQ